MIYRENYLRRYLKFILNYLIKPEIKYKLCCCCKLNKSLITYALFFYRTSVIFILLATTLFCDRIIRTYVSAEYNAKFSPRKAVLIDAGSTGTRTYVISYMYDPFDCIGHGGVRIINHHNLNTITPGISNFFFDDSSSEDCVDKENLIEYLNPLKSLLYQQIDTKIRKESIILFKGTAGVRDLDDKTQKLLMNVMKQILRTWGFLFDDEYSVGILSGTDEGIYAWLTLNQILNNFDVNRISVSDQFHSSFFRVFYNINEFIRRNTALFNIVYYSHSKHSYSKIIEGTFDNRCSSIYSIFHTDFLEEFFDYLIHNFILYYINYCIFTFQRIFINLGNKLNLINAVDLIQRVGLVEMGGASVQVVYEANTIKLPKNSENTRGIINENTVQFEVNNSDITTLNFCNKNFSLYVKTLHGLGRQLALKNLLLKQHSSYRDENPDTHRRAEVPCLQKDVYVELPLKHHGLNQKLLSLDEIERGSLNVHFVKGSSNYESCIRDLKIYLETMARELNIIIPKNQPLLLTENFHYFSEYVVLGKKRPYLSAVDLLDRARKLCDVSATDVSRLIHRNASKEKSQTACFGLLLMGHLLIDLLKLDPNDHFMTAINLANVDLSWTYGAALAELPLILSFNHQFNEDNMDIENDEL